MIRWRSGDPMLEGPAPPERSVHRHMLGGSAWAIALRWSVRLTGLVSTVVLARLLTPADYGVVAIAMLIVGTIEVFAQTGQRSEERRVGKECRSRWSADH